MHLPGDEDGYVNWQQSQAHQPVGVDVYDAVLALWGLRVCYVDRTGAQLSTLCVLELSVSDDDTT